MHPLSWIDVINSILIRNYLKKAPTVFRPNRQSILDSNLDHIYFSMGTGPPTPTFG